MNKIKQAGRVALGYTAAAVPMLVLSATTFATDSIADPIVSLIEDHTATAILILTAFVVAVWTLRAFGLIGKK